MKVSLPDWLNTVQPAIADQWFSKSSVDIAPALVGCTIVRQLPSGELIRGLITETEAYAPGDPACHGYRKKTPRNAVMFGAPGYAYVYIIYGMYHCLNLVTDQVEAASAVLIRALQLADYPADTPTQKQQPLHRIAAGPGKLCRVLDIDRSLNGHHLQANSALWVEHRAPEFEEAIASQQLSLVQTTRIGLTQGADIPWRWYLADHPSVSKFAKPER